MASKHMREYHSELNGEGKVTDIVYSECTTS